MKKRIIALLFCAGLLLTACDQGFEIEVARLYCEGLVDPLGIDRPVPRLGWELVSTGRNIRQTGYHILVASSLEKLDANEGDLWDATLQSEESIFVPYGGVALTSRAECYWKVKVTANRGKTEWSKPAVWTMGLLQPSDWKAAWTGFEKNLAEVIVDNRTRLAARYFRKEFRTEDRDIRKATLYISGLGLYEAYLNAGRIGEQVLSPTPTDYRKAVKYNTFDVTGLVSNGVNTLGVTLGNGRFYGMRNPGNRQFGFPKMRVQLEIAYSDGTLQTVVSDPAWKVTANGPIRVNNEYDGEEYDARMELDGWYGNGYDDTAWQQAEPVEAPGGVMEAQLNRNIKVMETIRPVRITQIQPGVYIMDMGQNMVGWVRMKVAGKKGTEVKLRFSELLKEDSTVYLANLRSALVTDKYILKGNGTETWEPAFTYHGFRFVEITGFPGTPALDDFEGRVVYDEMEMTGRFDCADPVLNRIFYNAYWGIRGNYRGMPTDCPQRDERMGWLGDRAVGSHGESFVFNNQLLYAKWLDDIEQAQREDGSIPDVAPVYWTLYSDNMTWPGAYVIIANMLYEQYGNLEPIAKHYSSMNKWIAYMRDTYLKNHILVKDTYGDWCMPPEQPELIHSLDPSRKTDGAVLSTTFYYRILKLMERFAALLDKEEDAFAFNREAEAVSNAFNETYFNRETEQYSNNTVTANLLPLCYGMVPDKYVEGVFRNIVDKTTDEFDGHVSTGLVGIQWLMRGLTRHGRADLALKIATNHTYPSWGYMIKNGATTIWELWNGNTADPAMNSANHVMLLGDLLVWYYEDLAGIKNAVGSAGFKHIEMKPHPVKGLEYVRASWESPYGRIKSSWNKKDGRFIWWIVVPCNTTATVYVPATDRNAVTQDKERFTSVKGVKYLGTEGDYILYRVGSGDYHIESAAFPANLND
ncbi:MAG: glycoside hydrolase family 78 protein [Tannerella sp.]|jgi:alpha-L-rhamnosidase|nr:glycoside hydrolase family 78 protein [Tannerella sp.]